MSRYRTSRVGVYPTSCGWAYSVVAPNGLMPGHWLTVTQSGFATEALARAAAKKTAEFHDATERYRVKGLKEARLKRPVEHGLRICEECGKPHDCYEYRQGKHRRRSWASLEDGHPYRGESWEALARRLADEQAAAA